MQIPCLKSSRELTPPASPSSLSSLGRARQPAPLSSPRRIRREERRLYLFARRGRAAEAGVAAVRAVRHGCSLPGSPRSPMPLGSCVTSWLPFLTVPRPPGCQATPSAGPSSAHSAATSDPCVLLAPGCRGTAPRRDMSLALGLSRSLSCGFS